MTAIPLTVAIVEADTELRRAIRDIVELGGWQVTGAYPNAEAALPVLEKEVPRMILMDIQMPGMSGIGLTRHLRERHPQATIPVLTVYDDTDRVFEAIAAGASGYLLKRDVPARLLPAMEELLLGSAPVSSDIALKMFQHFQRDIPEPGGKSDWKLTDRERAILDVLVSGGLYKEMADRLGISVATVRFHLGNIYKKLQVRTRTEAVVRYLENRDSGTGTRGS